MDAIPRALDAEPLTREELEWRFVEQCRSAGLPKPLVNSRLGRYVPDFLWPPNKLIVETDGWETHGTRRAFEADRRRDQELTKAGYRVVRFTWRQVIDDPREVIDTLSALLAPRPPAASAPADPPRRAA